MGANVKLAALGAAGSKADAELLELVESLARNVRGRMDRLEINQDTHRDEVEDRLRRYEETQTKAADKMVQSVERLARLETIPDRLDRIEGDLKAIAEKVDNRVDAIDKRVDALERRIEADEATQTGRAQATRVFFESITWVFEHGWKVVVIGWAFLWGLTYLNTGARPSLLSPPSEDLRDRTP